MWNVSFVVTNPSGPTRYRAVEKKNLSIEDAIVQIAFGLERSEYATLDCSHTGQSITVTPARRSLTALIYVGAHGEGHNDLMIDSLAHIPQADTVLAVGERIKDNPAEAGRAILRDPALSRILTRIRRALRRRERMAQKPVKDLKRGLLRRGWRVKTQPALGQYDLPETPEEIAADRWLTAYWAVALNDRGGQTAAA